MTGVRALRGRIDAIVIGASAGGVEALSILLPALPADLRVALFIVVHLPRERPSLLAEIFTRKCAVKVRTDTNMQRITRELANMIHMVYHYL